MTQAEQYDIASAPSPLDLLIHAVENEMTIGDLPHNTRRLNACKIASALISNRDALYAVALPDVPMLAEYIQNELNVYTRSCLQDLKDGKRAVHGYNVEGELQAIRDGISKHAEAVTQVIAEAVQ